jgi:uncharacterized protein
MTHSKIGLLLLLSASCAGKRVGGATEAEAMPPADVVVIGAGPAGLSASLEAARLGARVVTVEMNSVWGGHGVKTTGIALVGTPTQAAAGVDDSPDRALQDWAGWTVDGNREWSRFYAERSRPMLYDWLASLGVGFNSVKRTHGDSVPRFHEMRGGGAEVMAKLFVEAIRYPNIDWRWNVQVEHLARAEGGVAKVVGHDLRTGEAVELRARAVIIATGGFSCDVQMVLDNWTPDLPRPQRLLCVSGHNSRGYGHRMAAEVGAALINLDRNHDNAVAVPDPKDPSSERGFLGGCPTSIWVDSEGRRFTPEGPPNRESYPDFIRAQAKGLWSVYDLPGSKRFMIAELRDPRDADKLRQDFVENPAITQQADTLAGLAAKMGVPAAALESAVRDFNLKSTQSPTPGGPPRGRSGFKIDTPPYFATRIYSAALKTLGGIAIDLRTHVLDARGERLPGLYAAGDAAGSAGINGKHGLEGTYLGPAILTGRVAAQSLSADLTPHGWKAVTPAPDPEPSAQTPAPWVPTMNEAQLKAILDGPAPSPDGFWHFRSVHGMVLRRGFPCTQCHSSAVPMVALTTRAQRTAQAELCSTCHANR